MNYFNFVNKFPLIQLMMCC